jgi:hypothetical protein
MPGQTTTLVAEGLRAWANGIYPLEAAVELLIHFGGPLLTGPWVGYDDTRDRYWFNTDYLAEHGAYLSSGEYKLLTIAASLADPDLTVSLFEALPGLDRDAIALVLAAVAHAAGAHEHSRLVPDPNGPWEGHDGTRLASQRLGSLHPWPGRGEETAGLTPRSQDPGLGDD